MIEPSCNISEPKSLPAPNTTGIKPKANAKVVSPNAKPYLLLHILTIAVKVKGIVMLKQKTAISPARGVSNENANVINATSKDATAVFIKPNLSHKKPPAALPKTTAITQAKESMGAAFQEKFITIPTSDLITMVSIKQLIESRTNGLGALKRKPSHSIAQFVSAFRRSRKSEDISIITGQRATKGEKAALYARKTPNAPLLTKSPDMPDPGILILRISAPAPM